MEKNQEERREQEIVYSRSIKAGKRIYYLDVRKARNNDLYLSITESKRRQAEGEEVPSFEKHILFLYKEDFAHFTEGLQDVIAYVQSQLGEIEAPEGWLPGYRYSVTSRRSARDRIRFFASSLETPLKEAK